jgi:hypothetical protein
MPHTSHRKKKGTQKRRQEILDEDGWTRVTSTARSPLLTSAAQADGIHDPRSAKGSLLLPHIVAPMPPAQGSTRESMLARYRKIEERWQETNLCKTLEHTLIHQILTGGQRISSCAVFGTGSFSGDALHWFDRHESAYFQLAAFKTVVGLVTQVQGAAVSAYAQEPQYNELDVALLESLDISTLESPHGFKLLHEQSFAYSPAAEPTVEAQILERNPQIWLHRSFGQLDRDDESNIVGKTAETFQKNHSHEQLPALDIKHFPFHGSVIWWRIEDDKQG